MLPTIASGDRRKPRWWSPHLLPVSTLCAGILLGAFLAPRSAWSGGSGDGGGLQSAGAAPKHRLVVFYHVYVANNWQVLWQPCCKQETPTSSNTDSPCSHRPASRHRSRTSEKPGTLPWAVHRVRPTTCSAPIRVRHVLDGL